MIDYNTPSAPAPDTSKAVYISGPDASKMIKTTLQATYPGVKFSVRYKSYSGGSSIDVAWTDGPALDEVEALVDSHDGKSFDGMIDMEYHHYSWQLPDGRITYAGTRGTESSRGSVPAYWTPKPEGARLVSFHSGYLSCNRHITPEGYNKLIEIYKEQLTGWPFPRWMKNSYNGDEYIDLPEQDFIAIGRGQDANNARATWWRIQKSTSLYTPPAKPENKAAAPTPANTEAGAPVVEHDRDWTWIKFAAKPSETIINALKQAGGRWSVKRAAWYFTRPVTLAEIGL